ncbi:response regulator transcription factor [Konateibacter massiliensis]|uniref:response regulator transcription factor n=1 Tax=Konateibacter massiliensis TaxID=2002841 RepID=UPI000C14D6AA|nr:response regulator [Konateibacter massiliensis]
MYRILIAEDELIERMMLKKTLQKKFMETCEILEAENGKKALEIFRSTDIDIVILDIEMPGIKGIEAAEIMRREKEGFCIIFLTAYDKFEYAKKAISVHALEYLLKPYSEKELVFVVEEALHLAEEYGERKWNDNYTSRVMELMKSEGTKKDSVPEVLASEEENVSRFNVLVSMMEEYVRGNYMNDISMQEAARAISYSEPYFCKMFKQQFGLNFTTYLTEYRMNEAKKLLKQPNISVKEVGVKVGYPDSSYFARVFKRIIGISPSEYQVQKLKEFSE